MEDIINNNLKNLLVEEDGEDVVKELGEEEGEEEKVKDTTIIINCKDKEINEMRVVALRVAVMDHKDKLEDFEYHVN